MEGPHSGIVCNEANDKIPHRRKNYNIATHGILGERGVVVGIISLGVDVIGQRVKVLAVGWITADDLEVMPMVMEWMTWRHW
jgi:hypothetical protein